MSNFKGLSVLSLAFGLIMLTACSQDNGVGPAEDLTVNEDVAESVASSLGEDNGGAVDAIGDLTDVAGETNFQILGKTSATSGVQSVDASYDSVNGIWTIELFRERGNPPGTFYSLIERVYTVQFLHNGVPQKFWKVVGDTADTIHFNIIDAAGRHKTRHLSQELKELTASLVATGTNTNLITINGTYRRAATDTLTNRSVTRTLDHTIDLNFIDVTVPRGSRQDVSENISGTITGTYHADITFDGPRGYSEKTVDREINITLEDGEAAINVAGRVFSCNLGLGELLGD
ncbi:MAG TPA: hypothetical protein VGA99_10530 [bacterium]